MVFGSHYELIHQPESNEYQIYKLKNNPDDLYFSSICYRWVCGNENGYAKSFEHALELINCISQVKSYSPQEVYDSHVCEIEKGGDITYFMESFLIYVDGTLIKEQTRVTVKKHGKGYSRLNVHSLWLDDSPVLFQLEAGEDDGGDDSEEEVFITDINRYYELISYLQHFTYVGDKVVDPNTKFIKGINGFYLEEILESDK